MNDVLHQEIDNMIIDKNKTKSVIEISVINPIPAGVLENQDTLGGVNLTPPQNPMFYVQI